MNEYTIQHTKLDGIEDYGNPLDTLRQLAEHNLYLI